MEDKKPKHFFDLIYQRNKYETETDLIPAHFFAVKTSISNNGNGLSSTKHASS